MKKLLAMVLALTLMLSAAALPASAAFKDVSDPEFSAKLDLLSALGVVNGYTDGTYRPAKTLTRAEFTKLVVSMLGKGDDSLSYGDYTYFPDVRTGHWAARFVNYAARVLGLVKGDGSGRFNPDAAITYREAVTILLRALGYTDEMLGGRWPENYFTKAGALGLTNGLNLAATAQINRKDGAELFYNALYTAGKDGGKLIDSLSGGIRPGVLLISVRATAADGTPDALLTADGETIKTKAPFDTALAGRRGTLVLDKSGFAAGFIPEAQTIRTVTISRTDSVSVTDADGTHLRIPATAMIYLPGEESGIRWSECWFKLATGMALQVAVSASGQVDYITAVPAEERSTVLVLDSVPSYESLCSMLGAPSDARILKNGVLSTAGDLRRWDVASYTGGTGVIRVTDFRLAGIYEEAFPSIYTPDKITSFCGITFETLESAAASIKTYSTGDSFTMLFTPDGEIAGVRSANEVSGFQYGFYDGGILHFPGDYTLPAKLDREPGIVRVSQTTPGVISAIPMTFKQDQSFPDWNVEQMLLGSTPVSPEVLIVDRSGGFFAVVTLAELRTAHVEGRRILWTGSDSAGRINLIVLEDVTGAAHVYGQIRSCEWLGQSTSVTGLTSDNGYSISLLSANRQTLHSNKDLSLYRNTWCTLTVAFSQDWDAVIQEIKPMEVRSGILPSDFEGGGVKVSGITVPVDGEVQVLRKSTGTFLDTSNYKSTAELLGYIRNMGSTFTLCLDKTPSEGGMVRVIIVE